MAGRIEVRHLELPAVTEPRKPRGWLRDKIQYSLKRAGLGKSTVDATGRQVSYLRGRPPGSHKYFILGQISLNYCARRKSGNPFFLTVKGSPVI